MAASKPASRTGARAGTPAESRELRARGQRTLRTLLDAGIEVFATRGFHSARVDDIVKVANTSHGTFYLYFSNKEDLFRALALDVADEAGRLADSLGPLTPTSEGHAELRRWLGDFAALHERYGPVIRAWTEAEIGRSDVGRLGADVLGQFTTALAARIKAIPSVQAAPTVAALALVAMIERFNYYVMADQVKSERDLMLDTLTAIAYASLFGRGAP